MEMKKYWMLVVVKEFLQLLRLKNFQNYPGKK